MKFNRYLKGVAVAAIAALSPVAASAVDLTFAHFLSPERNEGPNIIAALERFRAKFPEVNLDEQISGNDEYLTQFNVGAATGSMPDVFMIVGADVSSIVEAGLIADIKPDLEADPEWFNSIQPDMFNEFSRGDGIYSVPYGQIITHIIYWNETIFKENGIEEFPTTWDGFLDAIQTFKDAGVTPISLGNKGRWVVVDPYMGTLAHRMHGDGFIEGLYDGSRKFTDPDFVAAIEKFQELLSAGAFNEDFNSLDNGQQRDAYFQGKAAMFIEGSWAIASIVGNAQPEVLEATRIAIWPEIEGGKGAPSKVTGGAGWSFGINPQLEGEKREAAVGLIKELSNVDYGISRLGSGLLPANVIDEVPSDVEIPALLQMVSGKLADGSWEVAPIFNNAVPRSYLDVAGQVFQELMVGSKSPMEVAEALQEDFDRSNQ